MGILFGHSTVFGHESQKCRFEHGSTYYDFKLKNGSRTAPAS